MEERIDQKNKYTKTKSHGPPYSTIRKLKFCQTTDTSDFQHESVKIFLRVV